MAWTMLEDEREAERRPLALGGRPMSQPLRDVRALAQRLAARLDDRVFPCGDGPHAGVVALARYCLELAVAALDGGEIPPRMPRVEQAAAGWAREGVSIEIVQRAVHTGFRMILDLVGDTEARGPEDQRDLMDGVRLILAVLDTVSTAVATGYVRELSTRPEAANAVVRPLVSALLGGYATNSLARECGVALAADYAVLAVHVAPPELDRPGYDADTLAAGTVHRLRSALTAHLGRAPLAALSERGGTVLLPDGERVDAVSDDLAVAAQTPVTTAVVRAGRDAIPEAVEQAHRLLDAAVALGLHGGPHRFDEMALEYQITRPGPALDRLAAILGPIAEFPDLMDTLRVHLSHDLTRRTTARRLQVHTNTVDYRLRRIAQLTGFDPTASAGAWTLRSALIAHTATGPRLG
ncbi:PucR family transcriptional regulator [Nocardia thailandica]